MKKLKILIINLDNINFTRNCLDDLSKQDSDDFEVVLVDQNSTEFGTKEFLDSINFNWVDIIRHGENKPLNTVWNWFKSNHNNEYLCFLNNDINLASNFVSTTIKVLETEPTVGIVVHSTNHPNYSIESEKLNYIIVDSYKNMQGWDYTIRNNLFVNIPSYLKTYCGDDFIFNNVYEQGFNLAYILNSPIIHYEGQSKKSMKTSGMEDIQLFLENKHRHYLKINYDYSNIKPTFNKIEKNGSRSS